MSVKKMLKTFREKFLRRASRFPLLPKKYECSVCGSRVLFFLSYGVKTDLFRHKKIVGGGYRRHVLCPVCLANDRMRWIDYVIEHKTEIYTRRCSVLHIAPEKCIEKKIRSSHRGEYITGDIMPGAADKIVDITKMPFENERFDYIILNHVLEHVQDEKAALSELRRSLKREGRLIFSVPVCEEELTYENKNLLSEQERLQFYGQKDHCRLYGKDVVTHIEQYGLTVEEYRVSEYLTKEEIEKRHLLEKDRIYIGRK